MSKSIKQLLMSIPIIGLAALSQQTLAVGFILSDNATVTKPAEGNGVCSDYASNSLVLQMAAKISCPDHNPGTVVTGILTGPDSVNTEAHIAGRELDTNDETATYIYDCNTLELSYFSQIPINFTLQKDSRTITQQIYDADATYEDANAYNQDPFALGTPDQIIDTSSMALCYDLPGTGEPPPVATLPTCSSVSDNAWLGAIDCTSVGDGTVVYLVQPGDPDCNDNDSSTICDTGARGANTRAFSCVCNDGAGVQTIKECSPNIEGQTGNLEPCYSKTKGQSHADFQTGFSPDPVWYTNSGGDAEYSCIDNPFTLVNECP